MLSFDITDRNIRIIKGTESGKKIRIISAATLNLEEEVIVNGHVKDVPRVATLINGTLKQSRMADKEAIVSISSNLTIFRELYIPKAKEQEFSKRVKQEMQAASNLDDSYSVSYTIVGEEKKSDSGEIVEKVLATACPYEIIESYKKVFQMLGIPLRSVMIGCNCITKVLLADTKTRSMMPLLAVQIDPNFISLNIYEKGQLSFSRFASIDPADYDNSPDYVFEAVNENIFRMLQFQKSRAQSGLIENVILYGDTHDYTRITDELAKMDLKTHLLTVPPQIDGYGNLEFSLYANAIGAMFKRSKETEKINLLETDTVNNNKIKSDSSYTVLLAGVTGACLVVVLGIWGVLCMKNNSIQNDIDKLQSKIDSPKTVSEVERNGRLTEMKTKVDNYYVMVNNAHDAYLSQPTILGSKYDEIQKCIDDTKTELNNGVEESKQIKKAFADDIQYSDGILTMKVTLDGVDQPTQKLPAKIAENMMKIKDFIDVTYNNYSVTQTQDNKTTDGTAPVSTETPKTTVEFDLTIQLQGGKVNIEDTTTTAAGTTTDATAETTTTKEAK
ncbi:MAG: pilus assembly protein PilM [Ruminococcus sp.]|jgi:type IV pilus assembly protein PilM|nr:pilus assembly protein PilM [Ruminococcus sp.]